MRKIIATFLSILILTYAGGVSITKHLCNDKVVAKAMNWQVKKCKLAEKSHDVPSQKHVKKSCCSSEFTSIKTAVFAKSTIVKILPVFPAGLVKFSEAQSFRTFTFKSLAAPARANINPIYLLVACFRL